MARRDTASAEAQRAADQAIADIEQLREDVEREIARRVRSIKLDEKGAISSGADLGNLSIVYSKLDDALVELGSRGSVTVGRLAALRAARAYEPLFEQVDPAFRPDVTGAVDLALSGRVNEIARGFQVAQAGARDELRRATLLGVTTGIKPNDLIARIVMKTGVAFHQAEAAVETAVISAGRTVATDFARIANRVAPEEEIFVLRYVGPEDRKNRPFCRKRVGDCFTYDEVANMDNGQGLPVMTSGGGYRCRHEWAPILLVEAQERGLTVVGL